MASHIDALGGAYRLLFKLPEPEESLESHHMEIQNDLWESFSSSSRKQTYKNTLILYYYTCLYLLYDQILLLYLSSALY